MLSLIYSDIVIYVLSVLRVKLNPQTTCPYFDNIHVIFFIIVKQVNQLVDLI